MLSIKLKIFCPTHNMLGNVLSSFDVKFVKFFLYPLGRSCIFYFNFSMLIALIMLTDSWMLIMYALDKHFCYSHYLLFNSLRLFYGCMCVLKRCLSYICSFLSLYHLGAVECLKKACLTEWAGKYSHLFHYFGRVCKELLWFFFKFLQKILVISSENIL